MQRFVSTLATWSAVLVAVIACAGGPSSPPRHCVIETEWNQIEAVDKARLAACPGADGHERARCEREDYLEARCYGINGYREALGVE